MNQLFLITGTNAYAIDQECKRWRASFREKHGSENLSVINGSSTPAKDVLNEALSAPFLAEKRLLCISPLPVWTKEEVSMLREQVHPGSILLFSECNPDKRRAAYKELLKSADVKTLTAVTGSKLTSWIDQKTLELGGQGISRDAVAHLIHLVGEDQFILENELSKLTLYAGSREITKGDIETCTLPMGERVSWQLIDLLVKKRTAEALSFSKDVLDHGESAFSLWNSRLLWTVSSLSSVALALESGITSSTQIASETGMKPFTVQSLLPLARKMDRGSLRHLVEKTTNYDLYLKTGRLRATDQSPEEILAVIDSVVVAVCS